MKNQHILVIGGTGKTGRKVVKQLEQQNIKVRIGSRAASPSFDWNNETNWETVFEGITRAYITYYPDLAVPGASDKIKKISQIAKDNGLEKLVLLSGRGEVEAQKCEEIIRNSGVNWTVVRATWFSQNFSESFLGEPIKAGFVALPKNDQKIPFVDTSDIADIAVEALLNDSLNSQIIEVTGPEAITFEQATQKIADATGWQIQFQEVSIKEYVEAMEQQKLPKEVIWLIEYLFTEVLTEENAAVSKDIERILGRPATSFDTYAKTAF